MIAKRYPKKKQLVILFSITLILSLFILSRKLQKKPVTTVVSSPKESAEIVSGRFDKNSLKTDEEWKKILTADQYYILRQAGTEIPFTGKLNSEKRKGTYYSTGCNKPLFRSEQKYESGTGWPSFWAPIDENAVVLRKETTPGDDRIEVLDTCGNHLGHVFDDGPPPTGKRYCMNSIALKFVADKTN